MLSEALAHTHIQAHKQKPFQETRHTPAVDQCVPGLKLIATYKNLEISTYNCDSISVTFMIQ